MFTEYKEIIYIITYLVSIVSLFLNFRFRQQNVEKELARHARALYGDQGALNVVDHRTCKQNRDVVFEAIRRTESGVGELIKKIDVLSQNVMMIKLKMEIPDLPRSDS